MPPGTLCVPNRTLRHVGRNTARSVGTIKADAGTWVGVLDVQVKLGGGNRLEGRNPNPQGDIRAPIIGKNVNMGIS